MICTAPITRGPQTGRTATGTIAGYRRHSEAREPACQDCADAWRRRTRDPRTERPPGPAAEPLDWRDEAACWGADPDLFFPEPHQSAEPAREICAECTVTAECLGYALRSHIGFGVWGGMSPDERRQTRRATRTLL